MSNHKLDELKDYLERQLKQAQDEVLECAERLDKFTNKEGEWDDIYDEMCQREIDKELSYKRSKVYDLKQEIERLENEGK
jgi:RNA polymerase-binding transcription factor DksA